MWSLDCQFHPQTLHDNQRFGACLRRNKISVHFLHDGLQRKLRESRLSFGAATGAARCFTVFSLYQVSSPFDRSVDVAAAPASGLKQLLDYLPSHPPGDMQELLKPILKPFSNLLVRFHKEDVEDRLQELVSQVSESKEAFTKPGEEFVRQSEAAATQLASQLVPSIMKMIENLNMYSNSALSDVIKLRAYLQNVSRQLQLVELPGNLGEPFRKAPAYGSHVLTSLSDMLVHLQDVFSLNHGFSPTDNPSLSSYTFIMLLSICCAFILVSFQRTSKSRRRSLPDSRELPSRYEPDAIADYFKERPVEVYLRFLQVVYEFSSFAASLTIDKTSGLDKQNEKLRAVELVGLIVKLGPTSIKIGQALSIRPDILPVSYLEELQKLQDRVPPFSNEEADELILDGLGRSVTEVFSEFSPEPVAAASLGQVYKAKLKESGDLVAVKVQRPGVLEGICRDLYILRLFARLAQSFPYVRSNLIALLDNWAFRFFDELDYIKEGENAIQFAKNMQSLPNIVVPSVHMKYTSRRVLTTQWIEGEKLSESKAEDLLLLVKVALNCYLMQLLESGFLHADPHPGNLLRTENGSLCVLDYGLMTQITAEQKFAFIDYISHLVNADYGLVAEDLVKLGFVPQELVDPEKTVSVVPQLSRVLGQLVQGGGARNIDFQQVTEDLSAMSRDYVFVVPPYFALILRAFSVLEGIGLGADPDFAIVQECYPYLSKRLITDDSPRTRAALKYFVYAGKERLDVTRVENLIMGFQTFQSLTAVAKSGKKIKPVRPSVDVAAKQLLGLVFSRNGSYLQELLLTELVRAVDALSRDAVADIWQYFASRALISLPPALLAPKSWPIPLPGLLFGSSRVATLSPEDQQSLEVVRRLWVLLEPQFIQRSSRQALNEAAGDMLPLMADLFPGMLNTGQKFLLMLVQRQALRLADDLDGQHSVTEWDKDPSAFVRRLKPLLRGP